jgi:hypothetical protein
MAEKPEKTAEKTHLKGGEKPSFQRPSEIAFWTLSSGSIRAIIDRTFQDEFIYVLYESARPDLHYQKMWTIAFR